MKYSGVFFKPILKNSCQITETYAFPDLIIGQLTLMAKTLNEDDISFLSRIPSLNLYLVNARRFPLERLPNLRVFQSPIIDLTPEQIRALPQKEVKVEYPSQTESTLKEK